MTDSRNPQTTEVERFREKLRMWANSEAIPGPARDLMRGAAYRLEQADAEIAQLRRSLGVQP